MSVAEPKRLYRILTEPGYKHRGYACCTTEAIEMVDDWCLRRGIDRAWAIHAPTGQTLYWAEHPAKRTPEKEPVLYRGPK